MWDVVYICVSFIYVNESDSIYLRELYFRPGQVGLASFDIFYLQRQFRKK